MAVHVMKTGRIFLLTWKFSTSKIVREFTLHSAPSFGELPGVTQVVYT